MNIRLLRTIGMIRSLLLKAVSKEFLIFLFFLAISSIFWLIVTLNETFEQEVTMGVKIVNVPDNYVITSESEDTLRFTVRDKGYILLIYMLDDEEEMRPLSIDFKTYHDGKGRGFISAADLQKAIVQRLYGSTKLVSFKSDGLEFLYNKGEKKRVPIKLLGSITSESNYYLSSVQFSPDSVTVYASDEILDSITTAYTERQDITEFANGSTLTVNLRKMKGAKFVPSTVQMKLHADILTEEVVTVPIETVNVPKDKVLRVFPQKATVRFAVGTSRLKDMPKDPVTKALLPTGFRVVVNYNEIASKQADKCRAYVTGTPAGIRNAHVESDQVDYVIEQQ